MLKLYQFANPWDVCSASPFCAKLEAFLRWQRIPYESVVVTRMKGAPKGKLPFIEDENGKFADSTFIIDYLCKKHHLAPDALLTGEQQAQARAIRYLCEESLYWAMVHFRWLDPQGMNIMKQTFFNTLPFWLKPFLLPMIKRHVTKKMDMQGMGRHTPDEIAGIACGDLKALSVMLGDKPWLFGDAMAMADLVVFSMVANFTTGPFDNPVWRYAQSLGNLKAHADHVRQRCFGDAAAVKQAA